MAKLLSHPNATLAPKTRQARANGEILNYMLSLYSDILYMIIDVDIIDAVNSGGGGVLPACLKVL